MRVAAAAYPLDPLPDRGAWQAKMARWVAEAQADLLVFPEYGAMELAGATDLDASLAAVADRLEDAHDCLAGLAAAHGVHILAPSGPAHGPDGPVNRAALIGPSGVIGVQDKLVLTRFERSWGLRPGSGLTLFETALGPIGVLICYDAEFPLLARALVEAGAEILLVPSCTDAARGYHRVRVAAAARALEGQCVAVQSPTVGEAAWSAAVDANTGAAGVFGPPDLGFPQDGVIAMGAVDAPGWVRAEVDPGAIRAVRRDGQVLNVAHWHDQTRALSLSVRRVRA